MTTTREALNALAAQAEAMRPKYREQESELARKQRKPSRLALRRAFKAIEPPHAGHIPEQVEVEAIPAYSANGDGEETDCAAIRARSEPPGNPGSADLCRACTDVAVTLAEHLEDGA